MVTIEKTPDGNRARAWLADARERARAAVTGAGERAGGLAACHIMSDALDELVRGTAGEIPSGVALLATGGWGRRKTCPRSDIDLLVLTEGPPSDEHTAFAERLLYPLWDSGLEVGHAVRALPDALGLSADDLATTTALLDARLIHGDAGLAAELERGVLRHVGRDTNAFVRRLLDEKHSRHAKFGDSLFLLEPNLKHGQGALRDLATGLWAARARWRVRDFADLVPLGQATARQVAALTSARDSILALRVLLHLTARRRLDQLTFEMQEAIAPVLHPDARVREGEIRAAVAPAVEELMRRTFLAFKAVVHETDRLLERAIVPPQRPPVTIKLDGTFFSFNGQVSVCDPQLLRDRPAEMVRLFRVALDQGLPVYGHTKEVVAERVASHGATLAGDRAAAADFLALLADPRDARQPSLLEEMHELGLLAAIMPEFAPCTARVQHDLYHVYTVDQHQLYAVALLKRIARGELAREAPEALAAWRHVAAPRALVLGTLLHDVGKPLGKGHAEKGARLGATIARRLGMSDDEVARVEFLIRHHLLMSHLSQRRDLDDPSLIEKFARVVGDEERLRDLYLLTYCDAAMTAPGNLTEWKATLLKELYVRTLAHLRRGESTSLGKRRRRAIEAAGPEAAALLGTMPDRYFAASPPSMVRTHVTLAQRRGERPVAFAVRALPRRGASELSLVALDAPGLLAAITGVLLAHRVDIAGAQIHSRPPDALAPGLAFDVFTVRDRAGRAIPAADPRWPRVEEDLIQLLEGKASAAELIERRREKGGLPRRVTPEVPTEIEIDNEASDGFTVIDVYTHDRPGVLHAITRTLSELGLDIGLSKVATEAERVADIFYVRDHGGAGKIVDAERLDEIQRRLREALAKT